MARCITIRTATASGGCPLARINRSGNHRSGCTTTARRSYSQRGVELTTRDHRPGQAGNRDAEHREPGVVREGEVDVAVCRREHGRPDSHQRRISEQGNDNGDDSRCRHSGVRGLPVGGGNINMEEFEHTFNPGGHFGRQGSSLSKWNAAAGTGPETDGRRLIPPTARMQVFHLCWCPGCGDQTDSHRSRAQPSRPSRPPPQGPAAGSTRRAEYKLCRTLALGEVPTAPHRARLTSDDR